MGDVHIRQGGATWKSDPEQAAELARASNTEAIGQSEAQAGSRALEDLSYVDQNWGTAGKFGLGIASGLTLGMAPGVLAQGGILDPGHTLAAQASPWYTGGDALGTVLPTLLSGGESQFLRMSPAGLLDSLGSGTERLVGGMLGEHTGLLGRLAGAPARMAARGAVEGAAITIGHSIGQGMVTNAPLAGEAMLAAGLDGALMGSLIGGSLGTVGSLGSMAVDGLGKAVRGAVGRSGARDGLYLKRLNVSAETVQEAMEGEGLKSFAGRTKDVLEKGGTGAKIGSSDEFLQKGFTASKDVFTKEATEVVESLDKNASHLTPDVGPRLASKLDEIKASRINQAEEGAVSKLIDKVKGWMDNTIPKQTLNEVVVKEQKIPAVMEDRFVAGSGTRNKYGAETGIKPSKFEKVEVEPARIEPGYKIDGMTVPSSTENPTWANWMKSRDWVAKELTGNPLKREIMSVMDSSIRESMQAAEAIPGLEGVAGKYQAAASGKAMAEMFEKTLGEKATQKLMSTSPGITPREVGAAGGMAIGLGKPVSAATWLATKGLGRGLVERFEPALAQMAFDMSIGQKATVATSQARAKIASSVKAFFKAPAKTAYVRNAEDKTASRPSKLTRAKYEEQASRAEQLISSNHQDRVQRYAEQLMDQGYPDLAKSVLETNARAVNYALYNMPSRQGTKAMGSLRKMPAATVPTLQEYRFDRGFKGIRTPMAVLDGLEDGSISRDQVAAMKYVYPELHQEIVQAATTEIYEMKVAGDYMPMSKISTLGILLDSPIDPTLEASYIGAVQTALNSPPVEQQEPRGDPSAPGQPMSQDLMTPLQKVQTV